MKLTLMIAAMLASGSAMADGLAPVARGCPNSGHIMAYRGTLVDKALIQKNFNAVILCNLQQNPNINNWIASMKPFDLARLSTQLDLTTKQFAGVPTVTQVLATLATRLNASNLVKIRSAFGPQTDAQVVARSYAAVQSAYFTAQHPLPMRLSRAQILANGLQVKAGTVTVQGTISASPILDMTIYEVYLEYYTAGWTMSAALAAAGTYIGSELIIAAGAGTAVGSGIYWLDDQLSENINIWIGDQIGSGNLCIGLGGSDCL